MPSPVQLYRYDISGGMAAQLSQAFIGRHMEAVWHTAIVAFGSEYYFDGGVGIERALPGTTRFGRPLRVDQLGNTSKTEAEFAEWVRRLHSTKFGPNDYNLLQRNCNHFSEDAALFLVGRSIPDDITGMIPAILNSPIGAMLRPALESMTSAPPGGSSFSSPTTAPQQAAIGRLSNTSRELGPDTSEELALALAILESSAQEDSDKAFSCAETLHRIVDNILGSPENPKFRRVSRKTTAYASKLQPFECVPTILACCGFKDTGDEWLLSDADGSAAVLGQVRDQLANAVVQIETERAIAQSLKECSGVTSATDVPAAAPSSSIAYSAPASGDHSQNDSSGSCAVIAQPTVKNLSSEGSDPTRACGAFVHEKANVADVLASRKSRRCRPVNTLDELLEWPTLDGASSERHRPNDHRRVRRDADKPRLLVCHDFKGGYREGDDSYFASARHAAGAAMVQDAYFAQYLAITDIFVYFSHAFITIPPTEWIRCCRKHAVSIFGTLIIEHGAGQWFSSRVLASAASKRAVVDRLVAMCVVRRFDGFLLNVESPIAADLVSGLVDFVAMLHASLQSHGLEGVIWYDAVSNSGRVEYQNALTEKNKTFFASCAGIFTNYWWNPLSLQLSAFVADSLGRSRGDIFVGIDVFGRNTFGGGGMTSNTAVKEIAAAKQSVALFAPGWTMESGDSAGFIARDTQFWRLIENYFISSHDLSPSVLVRAVPFTTSFRSPLASTRAYFIRGKQVTSAATWCQLSCQDVLLPATSIGSPDVRCLCISDVSFHIAPSKLPGKVEYIAGDAWHGDRCAVVSVKAQRGTLIGVPLLRCDLRSSSADEGELCFSIVHRTPLHGVLMVSGHGQWLTYRTGTCCATWTISTFEFPGRMNSAISLYGVFRAPGWTEDSGAETSSCLVETYIGQLRIHHAFKVGFHMPLRSSVFHAVSFPAPPVGADQHLLRVSTSDAGFSLMKASQITVVGHGQDAASESMFLGEWDGEEDFIGPSNQRTLDIVFHSPHRLRSVSVTVTSDEGQHAEGQEYLVDVAYLE